jgi:hypothetical protein
VCRGSQEAAKAGEAVVTYTIELRLIDSKWCVCSALTPGESVCGKDVTKFMVAVELNYADKDASAYWTSSMIAVRHFMGVNHLRCGECTRELLFWSAKEHFTKFWRLLFLRERGR